MLNKEEIKKGITLLEEFPEKLRKSVSNLSKETLPSNVQIYICGNRNMIIERKRIFYKICH